MIINQYDYPSFCSQFALQHNVSIDAVMTFYPSNLHDTIYTTYNKNYNVSDYAKAYSDYMGAIASTISDRYNDYLKSKNIVEKQKEIIGEEVGKATGKSLSYLVYGVIAIIGIFLLIFLFKKGKKITSS